MKQLRWFWIGIMLLLWWGVLFPETALTQDAYRVFDEQGMEIEVSPEDREKIYEQLLQAEPSEVTYKSFLWEWLQEWKQDGEKEQVMKKQAKIKVTGITTIDNDSMTTGTNATGSFEKRESEYILTYAEDTEDGVVENEVFVCKDLVKVSKRGVVNADMVFETGKKHAFEYQTRQGAIPFVASGGRIRYNEKDCGFFTEFDYTLAVGDFVQECNMQIEVVYV